MSIKALSKFYTYQINEIFNTVAVYKPVKYNEDILTQSFILDNIEYNIIAVYINKYEDLQKFIDNLLVTQ